jgi:hypothetical protein
MQVGLFFYKRNCYQVGSILEQRTAIDSARSNCWENPICRVTRTVASGPRTLADKRKSGFPLEFRT